MSDDPAPAPSNGAERPDERAVERVEVEVLRRLRKKFWFFAAAVTLLSYFGVKEIVRQFADSEIRAAQRAAILAEEKANKAAVATDDATKITEAYGRTVGALQGQAVAVQAQFAELGQRIEAERVNLRVGAEKARTNVDARLSKLEELVGKVIQDTQASRQALEAYRSDIEKAKAAAAAEAKRFIENSQYAISVQFTPATKDLAGKVQDTLAKAGFKVAVGDLAQAERFATAYATATASTTNIAATPTVNSIRFSQKATPKIQEIRDLVSSLVQFKRLEAFDAGTRLPSQLPFLYMKKSPTWADYDLEFANAPQIIIYLVEKP